MRAVNANERKPWRCRLFGHRFCCLASGRVIDVFLPSAECGSHLVGICTRRRCGKEWWS